MGLCNSRLPPVRNMFCPSEKSKLALRATSWNGAILGPSVRD